MPQNWISSQAANVTTSTTVYNPTASGVQATMIGCLISNTTSAPVTFTVTLTNATNTVTTSLITNTTVPAGNSLNILDGGSRVNVPQNYSVKVNATGSVDVTISAVENT